MDYFCFHHSTDETFNDKFHSCSANRVRPKSLFFTAASGFPTYFGDPPSNFDELCKLNQHYADIAASIQQVTEEILLGMARSLQKETGSEAALHGGRRGAEQRRQPRILRETPASRNSSFSLPPATVAERWARRLGHNMLLGNPAAFRMDHAYWGKDYSPSEVREFLDPDNIPYQKHRGRRSAPRPGGRSSATRER